MDQESIVKRIEIEEFLRIFEEESESENGNGNGNTDEDETDYDENEFDDNDNDSADVQQSGEIIHQKQETETGKQQSIAAPIEETGSFVPEFPFKPKSSLQQREVYQTDERGIRNKVSIGSYVFGKIKNTPTHGIAKLSNSKYMEPYFIFNKKTGKKYYRHISPSSFFFIEGKSGIYRKSTLEKMEDKDKYWIQPIPYTMWASSEEAAAIHQLFFNRMNFVTAKMQKRGNAYFYHDPGSFVSADITVFRYRYAENKLIQDYDMVKHLSTNELFMERPESGDVNILVFSLYDTFFGQFLGHGWINSKWKPVYTERILKDQLDPEKILFDVTVKNATIGKPGFQKVFNRREEILFASGDLQDDKGNQIWPSPYSRNILIQWMLIPHDSSRVVLMNVFNDKDAQFNLKKYREILLDEKTWITYDSTMNTLGTGAANTGERLAVDGNQVSQIVSGGFIDYSSVKKEYVSVKDVIKTTMALRMLMFGLLQKVSEKRIPRLYFHLYIIILMDIRTGEPNADLFYLCLGGILERLNPNIILDIVQKMTLIDLELKRLQIRKDSYMQTAFNKCNEIVKWFAKETIKRGNIRWVENSKTTITMDALLKLTTGPYRKTFSSWAIEIRKIQTIARDQQELDASDTKSEEYQEIQDIDLSPQGILPDSLFKLNENKDEEDVDTLKRKAEELHLDDTEIEEWDEEHSQETKLKLSKKQKILEEQVSNVMESINNETDSDDEYYAAIDDPIKSLDVKIMKSIQSAMISQRMILSPLDISDKKYSAIMRRVTLENNALLKISSGCEVACKLFG